MRIAMWSGPRNLSTAMMYAFAARADCAVVDEPFYAAYLGLTGYDHPMRDAILAAQPTDPAEVIAALTGPVPARKPHFYQKHMAHHLLPGTDASWTGALTNAFLIREPREMLASLLRVLPGADLEATGLPRQAELFERERDRLGRTPPVIDARDTLEDPEGVLGALCAAVGVPFMREMLSWAPGARATDGVWAKHWYASVEASTGFGPYRPKNEGVPARHAGLLRSCESLYERLAEHRLRPGGE